MRYNIAACFETNKTQVTATREQKISDDRNGNVVSISPFLQTRFLIGASCFARLRWYPVVRNDGPPPGRFIRQRLNGSPPRLLPGHGRPSSAQRALITCFLFSAIARVSRRRTRASVDAALCSELGFELHCPFTATLLSQTLRRNRLFCYNCAFTPTNRTCNWLKHSYLGS